jgi:hypothetical protein
VARQPLPLRVLSTVRSSVNALFDMDQIVVLTREHTAHVHAA